MKEKTIEYLKKEGKIIKISSFIIIISILVYYLIKLLFDVYLAFIVFTIFIIISFPAFYCYQLKSGNMNSLSYFIYIFVMIILFNLAFSIVYMNIPQTYGYLEYSNSTIIKDLDFETAFYYSGVAFTTVGFGDIHAQGKLRFLALIESMAGWIMLSMLIIGIGHYINRDKKL